MFLCVIKNLAIILFYALVSGLAAGNAAEIAAEYGLFGSCFEGSCGYGAVLFGLPTIWLAFFVLLVMTREWQLGWFSRGWRLLVMALLIFPIVCAIGFVLMLSGR